MRRITLFLTAALLLLALLGACATTANLASRHPQEVEGLPRCSECHDNRYATMDHTAFFARDHRAAAQRQEEVCSSCHRPSSCQECHAHKGEVRPSILYGDAPERTVPHRGDYLTRHRIEGRLDPGSCMPCHGRRDEGRCRQCHR